MEKCGDVAETHTMFLQLPLVTMLPSFQSFCDYETLDRHNVLMNANYTKYACTSGCCVNKTGLEASTRALYE
jgi:hypothetical protein